MATVVEHTRQQLLRMKEKLDALNIPFWLAWGTLLGAVRDNDIIPWDRDVDLLIKASDWIPDFCEHFTDFARCSTVNYALNRVTNVVLFSDLPVRIDVILQFYNSDYDAYITLGPPCAEWMGGVMPADKLDNPDYVEMLGTKFQVPKDPEEVLESIYGPDWRIPDPEQHWKTKPWMERWPLLSSMSKYYKGIKT